MDLFLLISALVPGVALLIYVYKKDKTEKEPVSLLVKLLILGAVICWPAAMLEDVIIDGIFSISYSAGVFDEYNFFSYNLHLLAENFIGIALVEEGLKWLVLFLFTRKNKHFNSLFDGIIYSVFVSLGFAIHENVLYVFEYGFSTALLRAITAVPAHMFFGVIMGYYYTFWHTSLFAARVEDIIISRGLASQKKRFFKPLHLLVLSLVMPILAHGFYDYCCSIDATWATVLFYVFLGSLYVYCFGKIRSISKTDTDTSIYAVRWLIKKYPQLIVEITWILAELSGVPVDKKENPGTTENV